MTANLAHVTSFESVPTSAIPIRALGQLSIRRPRPAQVSSEAPTSTGRSHMREFEDQIFNVLMDAIMRAERSSINAENE